jgi:RNA polymerase sigma-19 factor, ECF subfamily
MFLIFNWSVMPLPSLPVANIRVSELYKSHSRWLKGWLLKKLQCYYNAEDIAQDTFHKLLLLPDAELARLASPKAYLATIAKRLIIDQARRRKIENAYLEALMLVSNDDSVASSEEYLAAVNMLERIVTVLESLPQKPRLAFLLCRFEGAGYQEIAEQLGVSVSMVKQYIAQVMLKLYAINDREGSQ